MFSTSVYPDYPNISFFVALLFFVLLSCQ